MSIDHDTIRSEAARLLDAAGIGRPPVPLREVVSVLNLSLVERAQTPFTTGEAALVPVGDGHAIELYGTRGERRRRFTIAHEIGHFVLHPERVRPERSGSVTWGSQDYEREADAFAAELLMPEHLVRQLVLEEGSEPKRLAARFDVSVQAMTIRLARLGLSERSSELLPPGRDIL
jgi:hypothetical protein